MSFSKCSPTCPAVVAAAGRRRGDRARRTFAAFRLSLSAHELAAGFRHGAGDDPGDNPLYRAGGSRRRAERERLPRCRPLIGLVWSGERSHDNDLNRSLRLETLLPLLRNAGRDLVSLQHEVRDEDGRSCKSNPLSSISAIGCAISPIPPPSSRSRRLISADTAVAHLAGAMGKPLLLLLPFGADFRWLRERDDSPWYPTARLFRQPAFGDWGGVIERSCAS